MAEIEMFGAGGSGLPDGRSFKAGAIACWVPSAMWRLRSLKSHRLVLYAYSRLPSRDGNRAVVKGGRFGSLHDGDARRRDGILNTISARDGDHGSSRRPLSFRNRSD